MMSPLQIMLVGIPVLPQIGFPVMPRVPTPSRTLRFRVKLNASSFSEFASEGGADVTVELVAPENCGGR